MDFIEFATHYTSEESCKALVKSYREKEGIQCRKCGSTEHYWNTGVDAFDCKQCGTRTTLKSGTVMESSKLPFRYWIYAIYLLTMTKKSISALELQHQLGHKRYEPIWAMLHKLRAVMGQRDRKYMLDGMVELDDAFYKTHSDKEEQEKQKRSDDSSQHDKRKRKTNTPPHKATVWQPFPASLASLPNTCFLATTPASLISYFNLIVCN